MGGAASLEGMVPLLALLAAPDPFGLKTPWAGAFAAMAARPTDVRDVPGLLRAVKQGGLVRLAAGTYRLSGVGLPMNGHVVLQGAGMGKTVLEVGAKYSQARLPKEGEFEFILYGSDMGLRDLTVRNANPTGVPNGVLGAGPPWGRNERCFFDRVEFQIGNGRPVGFWAPVDCLVRDCRVVSTSAIQPPFSLGGGTRVRMEGCTVEYRAGRVILTYLTDSTVVGNTFLLDGRHRGQGRAETGGVELSFAHGVEFRRNKVIQTGPSGTGDNDGEMIMTQQSNVPEWQGAGEVVRTDGLSVTTDMRWGSDPWLAPGYPVTRRKAIYLLSGRGAGQWRWATPGPSDGTVRIDRAWDVPPAKGDPVSVGSVTAYHLRIADNVVENGSLGIELYAGGLGCEISGNTLRNTGGLVLRATSSRSPTTPGSGPQHFPVWDCAVTGNTLINSSGKRPAAIAVYAWDVGDTRLPLGVKGIKVARNRIQGRNMEVRGGLGTFDGVEVSSVAELGNTPSEDRLVGVDVRDNKVVGGVERVTQNRRAKPR